MGNDVAYQDLSNTTRVKRRITNIGICFKVVRIKLITTSIGEESLQKLALLLIQCADDLRDSTIPPFSSREQKIWPLTYCYLILVGRTKEPYTPATALASFKAAAIPDQYDKPF
jgi:hypothetical protein